MIGSGCAEEARLDMQSFAGRTWAWAPELGSQSAAAELPNVCVCNLTQHKAVTAGGTGSTGRTSSSIWGNQGICKSQITSVFFECNHSWKANNNLLLLICTFKILL